MRAARCQHFADDSIIPHRLYNVQTTASRRGGFLGGELKYIT
jgi:hypothetical protein